MDVRARATSIFHPRALLCLTPALALSLLGCSGIPKLWTAYPTPPVAILEPAEARPLRGACSRPGLPLGLLYVPHLAEVRRVESQLENAALADFACAPAGATGSLRQYLGVRTAFGRFLYVNAFPGEPGPTSSRWRREAVIECDGDGARWGGLFDLDEGRFTRIDYDGGSDAPGGSCGPGPDA